MLFLKENINLDKIYKKHILLKSQTIYMSPLVSITNNEWKKKLDVSPNEYVSLSTYYWPDPNNKNGRYIKKSKINYDKYNLSDRRYLTVILNNIKYLSFAYKITKNEKYVKRNIKFVKYFFLNSKTHMIPRLSHSGIIMKGSNKFTTHGCIVDMSDFWILGDLIELLNGHFDERSINQINLWFKNLSSWFLYSDYGVKASKKDNNWLTSYYLQLVSYLHTAKEKELAKKIFIDNFEQIFSSQIDSNGSQINEEARDYPIHYCNYNLHMLSKLALIGENYNIDIWNYKNSLGCGSIHKAMIKTAQMIKEKNIVSEITPDYNLTWLKIAYKVYRDDIFKELYMEHENEPSYFLNEFLKT